MLYFLNPISMSCGMSVFADFYFYTVIICSWQAAVKGCGHTAPTGSIRHNSGLDLLRIFYVQHSSNWWVSPDETLFHQILLQALPGAQPQPLEALLLHTLLQDNTVKYISDSPGSSLPRIWGKMVGKPLLAFPWWFWEGWVSQALLHPPKVDLGFAILSLILCKTQLLQDWIWKKKNLSDCQDMQAFTLKVYYLVSQEIFFCNGLNVSREIRKPKEF